MQTVSVFWRAAPFRLLQIVLVLGHNLTRFGILGRPHCIGVLPNLRFLSLSHLQFSVFTPMHRVRDPRVLRDDSGEVRDFLIFLPDFADVCFFFAS